MGSFILKVLFNSKLSNDSIFIKSILFPSLILGRHTTLLLFKAYLISSVELTSKDLE